MAELLLGPLLRYVGEDVAVFWLETDSPCEVSVLGTTERTFHVAGHHYGLIRAEGLEPGTWHEYEVLLDGERAWPDPNSDFPPSRFRTYPKDGPLRIVFGSCRVSAPHEDPYNLDKDDDDCGRGVDALWALARRMLQQEPRDWPDVLLMLGDQVYADEMSPNVERFVQGRRNGGGWPDDCVVDFEEYTFLYREAWNEPTIRWLLSTLSTAMVFDDHDVHDDWNISEDWSRIARGVDWWDEHIVAALSSYWLYQHVGNLAPEQHEDDELLARLREADDGAPILREFALRADRETTGSRWSYCRDLGGTRLVVIDSRAGRVLDEGSRSMVDEVEWKWIEEHATGGFDQLLIATSLPWLLGRGMHWFEAWNEAVCAGAWGGAAARAGEKIRRGLDLEHWGAFHDSFTRLGALQRSVAAGDRGEPPAAIVTLSGDVHHAYLSEIGFRRGADVQSNVWQAVVSPFRNPLQSKERLTVKAGFSRGAELIGRALGRAAGVPEPDFRWRLADGGPWFGNVLGTLEIEGRKIDLRIENAVAEGALEPILRRRLA